MANHTLDIGIDLDGVVHDFVSSLRHYLVTHRGYTEDQLPDAESWDFHKDQWGLSSQEFLTHCAEGVDAGVVFNHGDPYEGAVESLGRLHEAGHRLHVVTDRKFGTRSANNTEQWLHEHNIRQLFDSVTFSSDKRVVRMDIGIEDNTGNYDALTESGVAMVLMDRPWNATHPGNRVRSWEEFEQFVATITDLKSGEKSPESILEEALSLTNGARQAAYGHPMDDFSRTGVMMSGILRDWAKETNGDAPIPPELVGLCMVAVKISREVNSPKRDNRVDGAGYWNTVDMIAIRKKEMGIS